MLFLYPLLVLINQGFCKDTVPVIIWGNYEKPNFESTMPGLSNLRPYHFSQFLHKLITLRPHVLLFTEENLSIEDLSWRDDNDLTSFPNLKSISSNKDFLYLPSVESAISVFHQLTHHGYTFTKFDSELSPNLSSPTVLKVALPEPSNTDTRPSLLHAHDDFIAQISKRALSKYNNVLVAYTGHHASFVEPLSSRHRRQVEDEQIVMYDTEKTIFLLAAAPLEFRMGDNLTYLNKVIYASRDVKGDNITLDVKFKEEAISLDFIFDSGENSAWTLKSVQLEGSDEVMMTSNIEIGGPARYSYFCANDIVFKGQSKTGEEYSLTLRRLQAQPRVTNNEFGPVADCVPYFSSQILSGLLVSFLLIAVALLSIVFILDIHTMDKFDDPKSKTVSVPNE